MRSVCVCVCERERERERERETRVTQAGEPMVAQGFKLIS
jgi:hypothetical protein